MSKQEQEPWVTEIVETLRGLPNEWDDRHGPEFDDLSSDERAKIQRSRLECLASAGRLVIIAILNHGWLSHCRFAKLHDWAARARQIEQSELFREAPKEFLGMFIEWCREHTDQLPPQTPSLCRFDGHLSSFRLEDVVREDLARNCQAIAWLISATAPRDDAPAQRSDGPRIGVPSCDEALSERAQLEQSLFLCSGSCR